MTYFLRIVHNVKKKNTNKNRILTVSVSGQSVEPIRSMCWQEIQKVIFSGLKVSLQVQMMIRYCHKGNMFSF